MDPAKLAKLQAQAAANRIGEPVVGVFCACAISILTVKNVPSGVAVVPGNQEERVLCDERS